MMFTLLTNPHVNAQVAPNPAQPSNSWGAKVYGFVRNDIMYDSRQIISAREGDLSLYPKDKAPDAKVTARTNQLNNTRFLLLLYHFKKPSFNSYE